MVGYDDSHTGYLDIFEHIGLEPDIRGRILEREGKEKLDELLSVISIPKNREILEMRNGLNGYHVHTLEEVGRILGVTRERVRQREFKALEEMKYFVEKKGLEFEF